VITDNARVTCIRLEKNGSLDIIISCVYMPWNDRSLEQFVDYEATTGCLQGIIDRHIGCLFLFGGDLNVSKFHMSGCNQLIHLFSQSNKLNWLDPRTDVIDYPYHNDANGHFSLIDYFLASPAIVDKCDDVYILNDADNPSDHFAVLCKIVVPNSTTDSNSKVLKEGKIQWVKGDTVLYSEVLSLNISPLYVCQ